MRKARAKGKELRGNERRIPYGCWIRAEHGLLLIATAVSACGDDGARDEATTTAGGCACPESHSAPALISVACFEEEFPNEVRSYEEAVALAVSSCSNGLSNTERVGCGKRIVSQSNGYGGRVYVYDDATRILLGVRTSGDATHGSCQTFSYQAGVPSDCTEGVSCSLCDTGDNPCPPR